MGRYRDRFPTPSMIPEITSVVKALEATGLTSDDIIAVIRNRMPGTPAKSDIKAVLDTIQNIEQSMMKAREHWEKQEGEE